MTDAVPSTLDEVVPSRLTQGTKTAQFVAAVLRRCGPAATPAPGARDRYLEAAADHADLERRSKAWDAHEQAALSRISAGLL